MAIPNDVSQGTGTPGASRTAVLFPGQGAQAVGMVGQWCEQSPAIAALFARANAILGYDLEAICRQGPAEALDSTAVSQPGNVVASGTVAACTRLAAAAGAAGAMKSVRLGVAGAFHTSLMQPAVEALSLALARTVIRAPRMPVVSNVDARPHHDPDEIRHLLARQVVGVVEWQASVEHLLADGVRTIYEVGPGRVLRGLMKRIDRTVACFGALD